GSTRARVPPSAHRWSSATSPRATRRPGAGRPRRRPKPRRTDGSQGLKGMGSPMSLTVRVVEVIRETADAHSLVLEPVDGDYTPFSYRPGQFLTIRIPTDHPGGAARCYSLSSSPVCDEKLKVTVKRTQGGYGSNWICDNVTEGDVLE